MFGRRNSSRLLDTTPAIGTTTVNALLPELDFYDHHHEQQQQRQHRPSSHSIIGSNRGGILGSGLDDSRDGRGLGGLADDEAWDSDSSYMDSRGTYEIRDDFYDLQRRLGHSRHPSLPSSSSRTEDGFFLLAADDGSDGGEENNDPGGKTGGFFLTSLAPIPGLLQLVLILSFNLGLALGILSFHAAVRESRVFPLWFVTIRELVVGGLCLATSLIWERRIWVRNQDLPRFGVAVLCFGLGQIFLTLSFAGGHGFTAALWEAGGIPVLTLFFSGCLGLERISRTQVLSVGVIGFGCLLLMYLQEAVVNPVIAGTTESHVCLGLSAMFGSLWLITAPPLLRRQNLFQVLFWCSVGSAFLHGIGIGVVEGLGKTETFCTGDDPEHGGGGDDGVAGAVVAAAEDGRRNQEPCDEWNLLQPKILFHLFFGVVLDRIFSLTMLLYTAFHLRPVYTSASLTLMGGGFLLLSLLGRAVFDFQDLPEGNWSYLGCLGVVLSFGIVIWDRYRRERSRRIILTSEFLITSP